MRECPVCKEQGKLFNFWSGWVKGEDFQVEPEECYCEYCGFKWQQGQDLDETIKTHLSTLEYQTECWEEELDFWTKFKDKAERLSKVLLERSNL